LPPERPPGPRVAELADALGDRLGEDRRGYPGGERFLVALTHDVDLLGAGGARTAVRKLGGGIVRRSKQHLREGVAFALDSARGRDPAYPFEQMLDAEAGRGSTCFFLTRQEDPHDGYPERYQPALGRALERTAAAGVEILFTTGEEQALEGAKAFDAQQSFEVVRDRSSILLPTPAVPASARQSAWNACIAPGASPPDRRSSAMPRVSARHCAKRLQSVNESAAPSSTYSVQSAQIVSLIEATIQLTPDIRALGLSRVHGR
jgi:hypothetical protein